MSLRKQIIEMQVGERIVFPHTMSTENTLRNYASTLGFAYTRVYSINRNRKNRTCEIVRYE